MGLTVVTFRWVVVSRRFWSPTTSLKSCFGRCFDSSLRLAWLSTIVTSTSAKADGFAVAGSEDMRVVAAVAAAEGAMVVKEN